MTPRSESIYSHFKFSISRSRAPVSLSSFKALVEFH